jgi:hypothetical protein
VPAPASPWENRSDLLRGVEWWQARGYRVKLAGGGKGPLPADPDDPYVRPIRGGRASGPLAGGDL